MTKVSLNYVIDARNLACDYSQEGELTKGVVVKNVKIPRVGLTVIVGPSGSGKSTLLSLLSGIREPSRNDENSVLTFYDFQKKTELNLLQNKGAGQARLGFVFQEAHLLKEISARSNATIASQLLSRNDHVLDLERLVTDFGVEDVISQRASTLSGGQAQRIAVVRALMVNPDILVCDEPTSSLDEETGRKLLDSIRKWAHENGKAVLWVTHNLQQAAEYSDYLIRVKGGELDVSPAGIPHDLQGKSYEKKLSILRDKDRPAATSAEIERFGPIQSVSGGVLKQAHACASFIARTSISTLSLPLRCLDFIFVALSLSTGGNALKQAYAWASFIARIVIEYFYLGGNQSVDDLSLFGLFRKRWWDPLLKSNLIVLLALGVLVFSMLFKAQNAGSNYFETQLSKPEVSHFTIAQGSKKRLDINETREIRDLLRIVGKSERKIVFPRREDFFQKIVYSSGRSCDTLNLSSSQSETKSQPAPLLTFDGSEPLYRSLMSLVPVGDEIGSTLFATVDLLNLFPEQKPKFLCLDIDGTYAPFKVLWLDKKIKIPGGSDRTFVIAMTEQALQEWVTKFNSSKLLSATYSNLAIYFEEKNKDSLMCFMDSSTDCADGTQGYGEGEFLVNKDVFKQIDQFSTISYLAQRAVLFLVLSFILVMSLALGFAMNAEIKAQEKSLAILRAFGVSGEKISSIFQLRTLIQLGYASIISGALFWIVKLYLESVTKDQPWAVEFKLEFGLSDLIIPILLTFVITQIVTMLVVFAWSKRNIYVSEKLQGL